MTLFLFSVPAFALGVAVGPQVLTVNDALRGQEYEEVVTVTNPDTEDGNYVIRAEGAAGSWLSFYRYDTKEPLDKFVVSGEGHFLVLIKIAVPGDAANGTYTAIIYVETAPVNMPGQGGSSAILQSKVALTVSVTGTQKIAGAVTSITVHDTEIGVPARLAVSFQNAGNVAVNPRLDCQIKQGESPVATLSQDQTTIKPGDTGDVVVEWDTTKAQTGDYTADISVSLSGNVLKTAKAAFKVMPQGTFTMQGELVQMTYQGAAAVNQMAKLVAQFKNTGQADTRAKLTVEVNKNGTLVDALESDEVLVPKGEVGTLTTYYKPTEEGRYTFNGVVTYAGKKSNEGIVTIDLKAVSGTVSTTVSAIPSSETTGTKTTQNTGSETTGTNAGGLFGLSWLSWPIIGGAAGGLLVIIIIIFLLSKR